jgi:hypothetical protein
MADIPEKEGGVVAHQQREVARPSQSSRCNDVFASYLHVNEANEGKLKYVRILRLGGIKQKVDDTAKN